jgi:aspartokinase/homoserine dehydrogenase 1
LNLQLNIFVDITAGSVSETYALLKRRCCRGYYGSAVLLSLIITKLKKFVSKYNALSCLKLMLEQDYLSLIPLNLVASGDKVNSGGLSGSLNFIFNNFDSNNLFMML